MNDLLIRISIQVEAIVFRTVKLECTSELRLLVSLPTMPCFSISTVLTPSLCCSLLAMARPTAPPPITACVKSAGRVAVLEKQRADWRSAFALPCANILALCMHFSDQCLSTGRFLTILKLKCSLKFTSAVFQGCAIHCEEESDVSHSDDSPCGKLVESG